MCKRVLVLLLMSMLGILVRSEAQQLNYQAIARNANGVALTFRDVGIRLSIRDGSPNGSIVYSETRNVRTNQFGLFTVIIGSPGASNVLGSMASINWISGNKYLQVEIDPEGGNNYFQAGTSQLQAVPYALFANAAYPVGPAGGDLLGSTYPNPIIAPLAVSTGKLANQAVTTPKIADLNVTTAKLADQAITNPKIQDNTIANIKLVNSKVTLNGLILNLGDSQDFAVGTNGTDVNIISAGKTHTFNFPDASIANRGLITPNAQTIGGNKTFNNDITAARIIRAGGIAAQFLKADGSVDNNTYLTANQPIIVTATGDATGVSTSSGTAPVLPLTLATVNSAVGTFGNNITVPSITANNKGLITNITSNPIPTATATTSGLLTVGDWNTFNNKQNAIPLGTTAQYFRGDLSLGNFTNDVRNQLSAGTNITYANGNIGLTNNSVTINSLPLALGSSQSFATGSTGNDFNISSTGTVHSFNIPTASATNRGLLSSNDFSNFNTAYTSRITGLTTTGSSGPATLSGNVLNIPNYSFTLPTATASILGGVTTGVNITNTSGTISITNNNVINALGTQTANRVFASPDGANGLASFRSLALGDIQDNLITNIKLANSSINIGTTNIPLGGNATTLTGVNSITSNNFIGPLSGNASTSSAWANPRTISLTGDVTYTSNPFDGSGNTTGVATLANSGVTAGTYGAANTIPSFTVDAKGRLTSVTNNLISGVSTLGSSLNSGNIIVGNAANIAAQVPMTGDVTITNTGVTAIGALKVTDAMLVPGITDGKLATISTAGKVSNSATTATELNSPSTIVLRDGSGNFSAGNITANLTGNVTGSAGSVVNSLLFASDGSGAIPTSTFNGSSARTISYNSIGASPLIGSTSFTTAGTITTGTWNASVIGNAYGGAGNTIGLLKANGAGLVSAATAGTDYLTPFASQTQNFIFAAPSGGNGIPNFRALAASDIPTLNQNTTGSAGSVANNLTFADNGSGDIASSIFNGSTARTISYNSIGASPLIGSTSFTTAGTITTGTWNGSIINSAYGGTGNGFTKFAGPSTTEKTFMLPDASASILTTNAAVTIAQGGTGQTTKTAAFDALSPLTTTGDIIIGGVSGTGTRLGIGTTGQILTVSGGGLPSWAANTQWSVTGNSGLTAGTNFLGTTDAVALQFKVGNIFAGQIHPAGLILNTSFGLGANPTTNTAGIQNSAFGAGALAVNDGGLDNTAIGQGTLSTNANGNNNTAVGQGALNANTGHSNTAVGQAALNVNSSANNNTAVGKSAMVANTLGTNNTGIGHNALTGNTTGNANTTVGQNSLSANLSGHNNTAIGFEALKNTTSDGNVGVGHLAGVDALVSNSIAVGINSNVSSNNSIAIGSSAIVSPLSSNSISIGVSSTAGSLNSISIGNGANSSNSGAIAIGQGATASGENSVSIGNLASNTDASSILLGGITNILVKATGAFTATGRITGTGARFAYRSSALATTLTINDYYLKITSNVTITLPDAAEMPGQKFVIFNGSSGAFNNFAFTGTQTIVGSGWAGLAINGSVTLFSDGSNWLIEAKN